MIIPFVEILRRAGAKLSNTSTSTSNANDLYPKLKDWCNERYERTIDTFPWSGALNNKTLQIVASQSEYVLDRDVGKIWVAFDQTNGRAIKESQIQSHYRFTAPSTDQSGNLYTGDPDSFYQVGMFSVKASIGTTAEKVSVVSSAVADLSPNVVHVTGLVNGVELSEDIVLTGTTAVQSSYTYDASQKLRINTGTNNGVRKTIVGIITVSGVTSSTVFSQISPAEFAPQYRWIRVSPTPKATGTQPTWLIWHTKRIQPLVNDNDVPIIDICNCLVQGVYAEGLREDGQINEANLADQLFASYVSEKQLADTGPNIIEQFIPESGDLYYSGDFGRTNGSWY
jgi:hypothetical protein